MHFVELTKEWLKNGRIFLHSLKESMSNRSREGLQSWYQRLVCVCTRELT